MNNKFELFSLMCERDSYIIWFLNELNLTYKKLSDFVMLFDFIPVVLIPWDMFSLCHTPSRPLSSFQD